ncbi:YbhB/YbcL family Raf kinase inhibitor-like protein [Pantoea cypripedii]|uniref:Phospholipid-binding protein n=1 Tax=Pantoea cypripedii TaxID=55209 RepID=A0A1X1EJM3_PANCY|nr:YbhB/YbcL family Raf kinase inhibitor-like protein [Pantoea cypripedii]MBP2200343.1 Raf kinase inhibitor-like YbhB/YbcL family protein [Pantoea cypripedii]ORM89131.1 phospholipid-binding protein [Pantoea cypripedii]
MKLFSHSFNDGDVIPGKNSFAVYDATSHVRLSDNLNPHFGWSDLPAGTQSLVLICHDYDVPTSGENVNQEGKVVPASLPRTDFYHWSLFDIPATQQEIAEGAQSNGITAKGKPGPDAPAGLKHGINDYTAWFAGDEAMGGTYYGYDGPCPPWNDEIVHHYVFTLYALSAPSLAVEGELTGANIRRAVENSDVLAKASLTGLYTLNPDVKI